MNVVNLFQFSAPSIILMHLVNIQMCAALFHEVVSKVGKTVIGKINVVGSNIQTVVVRSVLDALQPGYHLSLKATEIRLLA